MAEYIEREAAKRTLVADYAYAAADLLNEVPAADVVSMEVHRQVMQERDLAIQQLREDYGVSLGEKNADVAPVVHGKWVFDFNLDGSNFYWCSICNRQEVLLEKEDIYEWCPYCHCGARMDGE